MSDLLFLVHRLPYPPNKGDKIRSFNVLQHLTRRYRVHLGTFVDDREDWCYVDRVSEICRNSCFVALNSFKAKGRSLKAFVAGEALTVPYYRDAKLQLWVDSTLRNGSIDRIVVSSSAMAQYVMGYLQGNVRSVIDFIDVDSDKWRQYAQNKRWPISWLYHREHSRLLCYEREVARHFNTSVFVSAAEAALFKRLSPELSERVTHIDNGVDTDYFSPDRDYPNPYSPNEKVLVFTGRMDYWPNVDAVCWFTKEIFPSVHARLPAARFYIVGARPVRAVRRLAAQTGVRVTGSVPDVRPYLTHACAVVAPLRIARGVQNKVLEAMAMAKPVLTTSRAIAGIESCPVFRNFTADDAASFATRAAKLLSEDRDPEFGRLGRQCVLEHYNWNKNLEQFVQILEAHKPSAAASSKGGTPITDGAPHNVVPD